MYEYIRGKISDISPTHVVIEAAGIGYSIHISLQAYSVLGGKTETLLYLHQVVREDAHILYGFVDPNEREIFRHLLSVNGVGASTAIMILSSLNPGELEQAIATDNVNLLKSVKGIGAKTAQRIIIDLKDKLGKLSNSVQILTPQDNTKREEALSALVMLGFAKKDAGKAVDTILKSDPEAGVETIIKQALKRL